MRIGYMPVPEARTVQDEELMSHTRPTYSPCGYGIELERATFIAFTPVPPTV